jgi:hypothetical protein
VNATTFSVCLSLVRVAKSGAWRLHSATSRSHVFPSKPLSHLPYACSCERSVYSMLWKVWRSAIPKLSEHDLDDKCESGVHHLWVAVLRWYR